MSSISSMIWSSSSSRIISSRWSRIGINSSISSSRRRSWIRSSSFSSSSSSIRRLSMSNNISNIISKRDFSLAGPVWPRVFQDLRLPDFHNIRHMKLVRLSASRNGRFYPQKMFLVLIITRGSRSMVRSEGICR